MNDKELEIFLNPPPGSKLAAAKEFGVDLTLLAENLRLNPQERIDKLQGAMRFLNEVRRQGELMRKNRRKDG